MLAKPEGNRTGGTIPYYVGSGEPVMPIKQKPFGFSREADERFRKRAIASEVVDQLG